MRQSRYIHRAPQTARFHPELPHAIRTHRRSSRLAWAFLMLGIWSVLVGIAGVFFWVVTEGNPRNTTTATATATIEEKQ